MENARRIAEFVAPARFAAVIKANAYGHGMSRVAQALEPVVDRFCIYSLEEALELRAAGIAAPLHVLGPVAPGQFEAALAADVELTLWDAGKYLSDLCLAARRARRPAPIQLKINTGVTRLGIEPGEAPNALEHIFARPEVELRGIFSHLAAAEELDSDFTLQQLEAFKTALAAPVLEKHPQIVRHIAASAAAILWPETRLDLVRVGIALYGLSPSPPSEVAMREAGFRLQPALKWLSKLVVVREAAPNTTVGYGRTFTTTRPTRVGVVPIGYAEGVPRLASNRGVVLINGVRCPIIGRVCMNMMMVDVTTVPRAAPGTPVTLIGSDGGHTLTAGDWARWCETIDYEIVARLPREVPRSYIE